MYFIPASDQLVIRNIGKSSFANDKGEPITFYRADFIDPTTFDKDSFTLSEDGYNDLQAVMSKLGTDMISGSDLNALGLYPRFLGFRTRSGVRFKFDRLIEHSL